MTLTDACPECLRRSWLLGMLGPYIERTVVHRGASAATGLLALTDEALARQAAPEQASKLIAAVAVAGAGEDEMHAQLDSADCWAVCRHSARYPAALRDLPTAPKALVGRGDLSVLEEHPAERPVAIVGSRRATSYGREVARSLARELADAGLLVISGLAFGIDACAHRGALDAGGPTVAVLGCGPDTPYPAAHRGLWRHIAEQGAVVSELPPGPGPWRWSFPARNRMVAGLAGMTVVVAAAARSGSLVTARLARESGRELAAIGRSERPPRRRRPPRQERGRRGGRAARTPVLIARPPLPDGDCPASTVYGHAKAWTPLLAEPLQGPVYLVRRLRLQASRPGRRTERPDQGPPGRQGRLGQEQGHPHHLRSRARRPGLSLRPGDEGRQEVRAARKLRRPLQGQEVQAPGDRPLHRPERQGPPVEAGGGEPVWKAKEIGREAGEGRPSGGGGPPLLSSTAASGRARPAVTSTRPDLSARSSPGPGRRPG
jgi:DNA protecting protein DprA